MKIQRSKNLDDTIIRAIVEILDGWSGLLTWNGLVACVEKRLGLRYTRQTLDKHERIKAAFVSRKAELANCENAAPRNPDNPAAHAALERLERFEAENARLRRENTNLLEQFLRWTYNAGTRGLSLEFLNQNIPEINRGQTDRKRARRGVVK